MPTEQLALRVDPELRRNASRVANNMGMELSDSVRIFLTKMVKEDSLPFPLENSTSSIMKQHNEAVRAMIAIGRGANVIAPPRRKIDGNMFK